MQGEYVEDAECKRLKITWTTLHTFYKGGWKALHNHFCEYARHENHPLACNDVMTVFAT